MTTPPIVDPNAWTPPQGDVPPNIAAPPPAWTPPDPNAQPAPTPQPTQPQPTAAQPTPPTPAATGPGFDPEMQAAAVHHSRLADALNAVGNILGGNKTLRLMKNPDGSVDVKQVDSTPGEKWGRVAQAALSGAAKGFAVGQGPGGAQRAAAAGIMSGMAMPQQQADQTMQQAQTANDQNRAQQLFKANLALLNQKSMANTFAMQQAGIEAGEHEDDRQAQIQKSMTAVNATKAHVGNMNDVASIYNSNKDWQQAHHDGRTVVYTSYGSDGKVNGADVYMVPEDQMAKPYDQPYVRKKLMLDTTDPTKQPIWSELGTIKPNAMSVKDHIAMVQSDDNDTNETNAKWQAAKIAGQKQTSETALQAAQAQSARAEAALKGVQAQLAPQALDVKQGQALNKNMLYHDKTYVQPAQAAEQSYRMADQAYKDYKTAQANGTVLPTGAQSMLMLSQHLANTFGGVKGSRITKDMIQEHLGARSISDDMVTAINKLRNGDQLAPDQWDAFHTLIGQARAEKWRTAALEGQRLGVQQNYLPSDLSGLAAGPTTAPTTPAGAATAPATSTGAFNWGALPKAP